MPTSQRDLLWRAKAAIWQRVAYHCRSSPASCQLQRFRWRHLQLCHQAAPRVWQTPWGAHKSRRACQRKEGKRSSLWLSSEVTTVARGFPYLRVVWAGKVCRLCPGQGKEKKAEEQTGLGRGECKARGKEEEEERSGFGGWRSAKTQEGAACQEAQVRTRLCCPSFPSLSTARSQSESLARDGAAQGLERSLWPGAPPRALLRGTGAACISAHAQVSKGITRGEKAPEASRSQGQQELSLLGHKQVLVNGVAQRKGNQILPLPAFLVLAEVCDSVVAGADSSSPAEALGVLGSAVDVQNKMMFSVLGLRLPSSLVAWGAVVLWGMVGEEFGLVPCRSLLCSGHEG